MGSLVPVGRMLYGTQTESNVFVPSKPSNWYWSWACRDNFTFPNAFVNCNFVPM